MQGIAYINPTKRKRTTRRKTAGTSSGSRRLSAATKRKISLALKRRSRSGAPSSSRKATRRKATSSSRRRATPAARTRVVHVKSPAVVLTNRRKRRNGRVHRPTYRNPMGRIRDVKDLLKRETFVVAGGAVLSEFVPAVIYGGGAAGILPGFNLGDKLPAYHTSPIAQRAYHAGAKLIAAGIAIRFKAKRLGYGMALGGVIDVVRAVVQAAFSAANPSVAAPASSGAGAYLDPTHASLPPGYNSGGDAFNAYSGNLSEGIYGSQPAFAQDAWS